MASVSDTRYKFGWTVPPPIVLICRRQIFVPLGPLRGTRFEDEESVIRAVRTWLREQEASWYRGGMHALVSRWRKAVDVDGDYVEKVTRVKETFCYTVREFHTF